MALLKKDKNKKRGGILRFLLNLFLFFIVISSCYSSIALGEFSAPQEKISAFLRVKDEIKTIEACLNSIDGVFDRIVIIHSIEKDDGSIALMRKWCKERSYCEIYEYPYMVIPSHDARYARRVLHENTLAAYYNFGLTFFEPEEWVVKIDGDQVYIKKELQKFVQMIREINAENLVLFMKGYNSFVRKGQLVLQKDIPINGLDKDHFAIKRKNLLPFKQGKFWEMISLKNKEDLQFEFHSKVVWFHFKKGIKKRFRVIQNDDVEKEDVLPLDKKAQELFDSEIRPLLKNSPYYNVKF